MTGFKTAALALTVVGVALFLAHLEPAHPSHDFENWKALHGKTYSSNSEEAFRRSIFERNVKEIHAFNSDASQTWQKGVNQFTDLSQEEFVAVYLGTAVPKSVSNAHVKSMKDVEILGDVDWVSAGAVTPVKDQGNCGSCWAFSAVGALESALLQAKGTTVSLSEQQLVDCSGTYGNYGCNGGWMDSAFAYVRDHGLTTTANYPYTAVTQACATNSGPYKLTNFVDVPTCSNVLNALNSRPVSVAVDASVWSSYKSGVLSNCGTSVNHGVLLVGATSSFWTIKNSWSTQWGESGFIRIGVGACGSCLYPSYPVL